MSLTQAQSDFAQQMVQAAKNSGHPWPGFAAAECSLESGWGSSGLAQRDKDVFGLKAPSWWTGQTEEIQTREVLNGVSVMVPAEWPVFPDYASAFAARLKVLQSMPGTYGEALAAQDGPEFVRLVSASWLTGDAFPVSSAHPVFTFPSGTYQFSAGRWSTAPDRASQVLATYNSHEDIFGA
jgi:hypothetical protein